MLKKLSQFAGDLSLTFWLTSFNDELNMALQDSNELIFDSVSNQTSFITRHRLYR